MAVTQTAPSPTAMSPPGPGTPTSIVAATLLVAGSTRDTLPSPWFKVQMAPIPAARNRGSGPTGIFASTFSLAASTRVSRLPLVLVIQTEPPSNTAVNEPGGMETFDTTLFIAGS